MQHVLLSTKKLQSVTKEEKTPPSEETKQATEPEQIEHRCWRYLTELKIIMMNTVRALKEKACNSR